MHPKAFVQAPKQSRITPLDGVRAIAILSVYFHHAFQIKLLWMGVDLFFVLSGFLITGILLKQKHQSLGAYLGHFYKRRARRILPPYIVLMIITTIIFSTIWMKHAVYFVMMMNYLRAASIVPVPTLSPLWSLAVEEQFYLLWPFAAYFLSEAALGWTAAALIVVVPALRWIYTPRFATHWPIYCLTPFRADLLLMGALLALAWIHHRSRIERYGQFGLLLVPAAAGFLYFMSSRYKITTYSNTQLANVVIYEASLFACTGVILWALSGRGVGILKLAPVTYLGRISYTFYLMFTTVLFLVGEILFHGQHIYLTAAISLVLTILYAATSWHLLELPLLGWKPKETSAVLDNSEQVLEEKALN